MAEKRESNIENLSVKVDVDVSDALTGLKAVTREAKEAMRALKGLEKVQGVDFAAKEDYTTYTVVVCTSETDPHKVLKEVSKHVHRSSVYHWRFTNKELLRGIDKSKTVVIYDKPSDIDTYYFGTSIHLTFEQWKTLSKLFTKE